MLTRSWNAALAVVVAVVAVGGSIGANAHQSFAEPLDWFGYLLLLAGPAALIVRERFPISVLLAATAAAVAYVARYGYGPVFVALVVAFLTAASVTRAVYALLPLGFLALVWPGPFAHSPPGWWGALGIAAWLLVLVAAAEGLRQRRAIVAARRERERAAAESAEQDRLRRASDERLAIARELHDVLAHSLSLINVQSSVALELFDTRPEQAAVALAAIKTASRDALSDVHALLSSIRSGVEQPPTAPAPSVADLDDVVARARAAGLEVATSVTGTVRRLPSVVDVAAARIVQESLTNVVRHASGARASVELDYAPGELRIRIVNTPGAASVAARGGSGIRGMRERAEAIGGRVSAGVRPGGGFRVDAALPVKEDR